MMIFKGLECRFATSGITITHSIFSEIYGFEIDLFCWQSLQEINPLQRHFWVRIRTILKKSFNIHGLIVQS
jgi:hypothetical protein